MSEKPTYEELRQRVEELEALEVEQQQALAALRESKGIYRSIVESIPGITYRCAMDRDWTMIIMNEYTEQVCGYPPSDFINNAVRTYESIIHREDTGYVARSVHEAIEAGQPWEIVYRILHKNGNILWVHEKGKGIADEDGQVQFLEGVIIDITDSKQAEEVRERILTRQKQINQLQEYLLGAGTFPEKLQAITDGVVESFQADFCRIWITGPGDLCESGCRHSTVTTGPDICTSRDRCLHLAVSSGRYTHIDGSHQRVPFGCYKIGKLGGGLRTKFLTNNATQDPQIHDRKWAEALGLQSFAGYQLRDVNGETIGVLALFSKQVIEPEDDALLESLGNSTAQVIQTSMAEEALQASEKKYRNLFHYSNDGIYIHDLEGRIIEVNQKALGQSGMTSEEIGSAMITELLAPEAPETTGQLFREISRQGFLNYEMIGRRKNGETFPAEVSSSLLELGGEQVVQSVVRDISERKKLEEELLKVQKLESTGILAGGIAHDFNNLLMAIMGNISMAKLYVETDGQAIDKLNDAEKACVRAQDLTKQLLTFSKGGEPLIKPEVIPDLLRDSIFFTLSGSKVRSTLQIADDLWPVMIDAGQISHVIQNVVKNADQAMPEGGTVTIRAENKIITTDEVVPLAAGNYVKITIADTGVGIPANHITKVFDPYFSTKKEGSGLGLAGAYSILKNHGGFITLDSELGKGTTFHIYLPAAEITPSAPEDSQKLPLAGVGKILLMDDEEAVAKVATSMLTFMGYSVVTARDGAEALELYRKAKNGDNPFDAVILDLTIPGGMGGKETIQKLLEIDPEVKAIVSSGYANYPIMAAYEDFGFRDVVAKPYSIQELSKVLRNLLK